MPFFYCMNDIFLRMKIFSKVKKNLCAMSDAVRLRESSFSNIFFDKGLVLGYLQKTLQKCNSRYMFLKLLLVDKFRQFWRLLSVFVSHLLLTNIGKLVSLAVCSRSLVLAGLLHLFLFGALFTGSESTVIGTIQDKNILSDTNKLTKSVLYCSCFMHFITE